MCVLDVCACVGPPCVVLLSSILALRRLFPCSEPVDEDGEKTHPWADELWTCDLLTQYFVKLAPKSGDEGKTEEAVQELAGELKGLKMAKGKGVRGDGDDDLSFFDGKKAKGGKKAKAPAKAKVQRCPCLNFPVTAASFGLTCVCVFSSLRRAAVRDTSRSRTIWRP